MTKSDLTISGGVNRFTLKSPSTIYPKSSVRFTPNRLYDLPPYPPKSPGKIYPSNCQVRFTPPLKSSNFEQNFKRTQDHALLHKGLFCERPNSRAKSIDEVYTFCRMYHRLGIRGFTNRKSCWVIIDVTVLCLFSKVLFCLIRI